MTPILILAVQCSFSLVVFYLLIKWYLVPRVQTHTLEILALLLVVNVFRYLPLSLFMPGQVSTDFPEHIKGIVAYGDFLSGLLALLCLILLKSGSKATKALIWIFSIVSITDMILALSFAMASEVYELPLGANYFTVSVYVPLLIVVQVFILKILFNKSIKV